MSPARDGRHTSDKKRNIIQQPSERKKRASYPSEGAAQKTTLRHSPYGRGRIGPTWAYSHNTGDAAQNGAASQKKNKATHNEQGIMIFCFEEKRNEKTNHALKKVRASGLRKKTVPPPV